MPEIVTTKVTTIELNKTDGELRDVGQEDIVVDLPYVGLVARLIRDKEVDADPDMARMSPALGLGVVVVQDIKALADQIDIDSEERVKVFQPDEDPQTNLDKVLVWLRQEFLLIDPDSKIEVGKNRTAQGVHGTPHIGGGGYPTEAAKPAFDLETETSVSSPVRVGLIDTRVYQHENFGKRLKFIGRGELPPVPPFNHLDIHGTFTVGLILEKAPKAEVVVKAVLRHDLAKATAWDVASTMAEFIDQKVQLVVLPLVCFTADGKAPLALQRAVTLLRTYGIPVIAAAGNHGSTLLGFPAACAGAIAVGASDKDGTLKAEFNPQEEKPWITLAGPGVDVESTSVYGQIKYVEIPDVKKPVPWDPQFHGGAKWSGTSFATATIGGEIAKRLAAELAKPASSRKSPFEIIKDLEKQSPAAHNGIGGYGLL